MSALFTRIDTVFLKVHHFEKAIEWYCNMLGFTVKWKDEQKGYASLQAGETPLTLVRASEDDARVPDTAVFFSFFTPYIELAHDYLLQHGIQTGPMQDDGVVKSFSFQDIEGNWLEVCHFTE